jgi:hypothetical protein
MENKILPISEARGRFVKQTVEMYIVLVCGESSNNIVQFSPIDEVVGEILTSDGKKGKCRAVCYDRNQTRLIVGYRRDYIEIYDMQ